MVKPTVIEILNKSAYWRADQIAAIELSANSVFIIPIATPERNTGYVYRDTKQAEEAYKKLLADWRAAIAA